MIYELSKEFYFDAAHTLDRYGDGLEASKRIHGHTYHSRITISGNPDVKTGMIIDVCKLNEIIAKVIEIVDHQLLDNIPDLQPATLENLCTFLWKRFESFSIQPIEVLVERKASGDRCILRKSKDT